VFLRRVIFSLELISQALYHFHRDQEREAWRHIGLAARFCMELGFHRFSILLKTFPDEAERERALVFFWSIFVLDRRWSFGISMPFALHDKDIDPNLPQPVRRVYMKSKVEKTNAE
jgi:hypothetical protein